MESALLDPDVQERLTTELDEAAELLPEPSGPPQPPRKPPKAPPATEPEDDE
jgi:hypothetical protein